MSKVETIEELDRELNTYFAQKEAGDEAGAKETYKRMAKLRKQAFGKAE